ncbi:Cytochrome b5-like Heme/Steroid binding domain [Carpediemonas membranifera]|uniref:Cytochrome b5-like Heme/Steroid binding domain n=1 Tax=Carpediemonas membranifera TaxID=201153 RepID=A0A8J6E435_9EUKA|nr:Cytochrome b5-like Heme/Steroid binding domain [Carpediemonas membranifera]|eukprot:KAG9393967.1 Cytochrome b5-like Heme/Steroid binding domain [Carpediemonas membranifera]
MKRTLMPSYDMTHVHTTAQREIIPEDQLPIIPLAEVRQHNDRKDAWIVINGDVFDVTTYARSHPGGMSIFGSLHQVDSTPCFALHHRSQRAFDRAKSLRIGRLSPEDYQQLKDDVEAERVAENERIMKRFGGQQ